MTDFSPILITGAGGEIGSVSRGIAHRLLEQGYPVRAFVRSDDERAEALREAGAEVFVGDLLNIADVASALKGCKRIFFTMSLSPYYLDANLVMIAAARQAENIEVLVNISDIEQSYMTYEHMSADRKHRLQWLGGLADQWSPQQRAHWLAEQALNWSDLPAVHVRPTIFVENPLLTWFPLENMYKKGELCLPFGSACISPIAAKDVADVCANILISPKAHIGKSYALTGPESLSMNQIAAEFSRVLERKVAYVSLSIDHSDNMIDTILAKRSVHTAEHLKVLTRLIAGGRYEVVTDVLEKLLGRMPTSFGEAMAANSTVNKFIDDKK